VIQLATPFRWLAVAGFVASAIVHVSSLLGLRQPFGEAAWGLHIGIFVVWLPTVIVAQRLSKGVRQAEFWKATLRGCPPWMKRATGGLFAYALLNFFVGIALGPESESDRFRIFSGHWMVFYFVAAVTLYSAGQLGSLAPPRCPNGHDVSPFAKFCGACGAAIPPAPIV
jgi:hypothetical protein